MKKFTAIFSICLVLLSIFSITASAQTNENILISRTVDVFENGDTFVTELYQPSIQPRTGATGYKTGTYYNASGAAIWSVTVNGSFTYSYGVSSCADSASATVKIYNNNATFLSKNAYTSGNTATATASVRYAAYTTNKSISVSCDIYGNLY